MDAFSIFVLSSFLEEAGYEVCIIDSRVENDWEIKLRKELKDTFALGITSMSGPDLKPAMEAAQIARDMSNDIKVIWGGHHVQLYQRMFSTKN